MAAELHTTVGEMLARMSNREFIEWHAYYGLKSSKEKLAQKSAGRGK